MIERTQKKLREAKFFLGLLNRASQEVVRNEAEAFDFYLSAFLSAARSVTFVLQHEEKDKYDAWFPAWLDRRPKEDRQFLDFLKVQHNYTQKRGGAEVVEEWEWIPVTNVRTDERDQPAYQFEWSGPPETPCPEVGVRVHFFEFCGNQTETASACKRYMEILERLVEQFMRADSGG